MIDSTVVHWYYRIQREARKGYYRLSRRDYGIYWEWVLAGCGVVEGGNIKDVMV